MPGMMRREDKALSSAVAQTLLESGEYGILSTMGEDGYPYGVPISFAYTGGVLYVHSAPEGHKVSNIAHNEKISFCVVGFAQVQPSDFNLSFASVIAFGKAHQVDGDEKKKALQAIAVKYTDRSIQDIEDYIASEGGKTIVFRIDIDSLTAKGNLLMAKDKAATEA